jgi:hypothetical protein
MEKKNSVMLILRPVLALVVGLIIVFMLGELHPAAMGCAICITVGMVFIFTADAVKQFSIASKEACSYTTSALVTGYTQSSDDSSSFPVYTYVYGGEEYTVRSNVSDSFRNPPVGAEVDIFLNPENPTESYIADLNRTSALIAKIFLIVGALLVVTGVCLFLLITVVTI